MPMAGSRSTSRMNLPARRRKLTGFLRRKVLLSWPCASTGRRKKQLMVSGPRHRRSERNEINLTDQLPKYPIMKATHSLNLLAVALVSTLAFTSARAADLTAVETKAIAEEGFIYGLPIVMNYAVMYEYAVDKNSGQFKAPFNEIKNEARVYTYEDTAVITPNSDTPYSLLWLDLRAEPIVLSVPAVEKSRYYSVMLCDGNTFNYGYIGSRATGPDAGDYLVVGPDWKGETPAGIKKVFRSSTQFSVAVYRTQLINPADMPNVVKIQAGYKVRPLSAYLKQPTPPAAPAINFPKIDKELVKTNFFDYLDFALQIAPPGPEKKD